MYELVDKNKRKSNLIMIGFIAFISLAAYLITYAFDMSLSVVGFAFIFSGISSFLSYYFSDDFKCSPSANIIELNVEKYHFLNVASGDDRK